MERERPKIIWGEHVGAIVHVGIGLTADKEKEFEQEYVAVSNRIGAGRARMEEMWARKRLGR